MIFYASMCVYQEQQPGLLGQLDNWRQTEFAKFTVKYTSYDWIRSTRTLIELSELHLGQTIIRQLRFKLNLYYTLI